MSSPISTNFIPSSQSYLSTFLSPSPTPPALSRLVNETLNSLNLLLLDGPEMSDADFMDLACKWSRLDSQLIVRGYTDSQKSGDKVCLGVVPQSSVEAGCTNLSMTCYMNTALQQLRATPLASTIKEHLCKEPQTLLEKTAHIFKELDDKKNPFPRTHARLLS